MITKEWCEKTGKVRCYPIGIDSKNCPIYQNKRFSKIVGNSVGLFRDTENDMFLFMYATVDEQNKAYDRFNRKGKQPVLIETPIYIDKKWIDKVAEEDR